MLAVAIVVAEVETDPETEALPQAEAVLVADPETEALPQAEAVLDVVSETEALIVAEAPVLAVAIVVAEVEVVPETETDPVGRAEKVIVRDICGAPGAGDAERGAEKFANSSLKALVALTPRGSRQGFSSTTFLELSKVSHFCSARSSVAASTAVATPMDTSDTPCARAGLVQFSAAKRRRREPPAISAAEKSHVVVALSALRGGGKEGGGSCVGGWAW